MFHRGDVPRMDWLDKLTFKEIDRVQGQSRSLLSGASGQPMELTIQLPRFLHDVLYQNLSVNHPTLGPYKEDIEIGSEVG